MGFHLPPTDSVAAADLGAAFVVDALGWAGTAAGELLAGVVSLAVPVSGCAPASVTAVESSAGVLVSMGAGCGVATPGSGMPVTEPPWAAGAGKLSSPVACVLPVVFGLLQAVNNVQPSSKLPNEVAIRSASMFSSSAR